MPRIVCHFSCGAASAVATKFTLAETGGYKTVVAYAETGAEDDDNKRFLKDCEIWFKQEVIILRSNKYQDTWDVWGTKRYIAGPVGGPCTSELKIKPQEAFQRDDDIHVFGYTSDQSDRKRAAALRENRPHLEVRFPLIDRGLNKQACLAILHNEGIRPPRVYELGFSNANCIPCCKATSPSYWALVRKVFPEQFSRMDKLSRELGATLARVHGVRVFIGDIPEDWPTTEAIAPACDHLCQLAEQELQFELNNEQEEDED